MRDIEAVKIEGLFGYIRHDVKFSKPEPVTIISGPNGIGKTHFLRLLHAVIKLDLHTLSSVDFRLIEVRYAGKWILKVRQMRNPGGRVVFRFSGKKPRIRSYQHLDIAYDNTGDEGSDSPDWMVRLPDGNLFDTRLERVMSVEQVKRYGLPTAPSTIEYTRDTWLEEFYKGATSILIDTQRLDNVLNYPSPARIQRSSHGRSGAAAKRIHLYIDQVAAQLSDARRKSLNESLEADQTFASRVLQRTESTINAKDLRERYQRIADQHAELHASGLSVRPVDVRFPKEEADETERRILNVFLDDWERKLKPLLPIHGKLKSLRRIVESKFVGKEMYLNDKGRIRFRSKFSGKPVGVQSLSSGEQHLLAVFTMLLFSAEKGALVLIDEPEISMHAAWKHSFIEDITEVARISELQIVLATHSSAIIKGRWDLVQEIEAPEIEDTSLLGISEVDEELEGDE
ncbi:AAA family ATPase [Streptomyces sp. NPDC094472]|uniref:AAA family ATPase n=1 Tax=Streptomyces sp. NPDC094472 TaxID=3155080 RepID=UPI00331A01E0